MLPLVVAGGFVPEPVSVMVEVDVPPAACVALTVTLTLVIGYPTPLRVRFSVLTTPSKEMLLPIVVTGRRLYNRRRNSSEGRPQASRLGWPPP